jgi:glutamate N-acetyltransferase / amino-acid N-acetyltransferase
MIKGIEFSGIASGIKPTGLDLGLVFFREEMNVLTLYTSNKVKAAHILYDKKLDRKPVRALLVNSGCANACTGKEGISDLADIGEKLARPLKIDRNEILFASTGVIGKRLPADTIKRALPMAIKKLKEAHIEDFAKAIMTTDTHQKLVQKTIKGKKEYTIVGIAKGSGMINPLFATMLAFVFTDYPVSPETIRTTFRQAAKESFEKITVDGECSTNDTIMLFTKKGTEDLTGLDEFKDQLRSVMKDLAMMVVRDGEGATKIAHIIVNGAKKKDIAEKIARRIATSPLTKTAFFGCDPNWGRIICAAGDAGVPVEPSKVDIALQGEQIVKGGMELPFDEQKLKAMMNKKEIDVVVNLNDGKASFDIFTTDLTFDYIKINASYRS